jgi:small subunit ribosomal protein S1
MSIFNNFVISCLGMSLTNCKLLEESANSVKKIGSLAKFAPLETLLMSVLRPPKVTALPKVTGATPFTPSWEEGLKRKPLYAEYPQNFPYKTPVPVEPAEGEETYEDLRKAYDKDDPPRIAKGEIVEATIKEFIANGKGASIDLGPVSHVVLRKRDLSLLGNVKAKDLYNIGDKLLVQIEGFDRKGRPEIHRRDLLETAAWETLENYWADEEPFEVQIVNTIGAGAQVSWQGIEGFLPVSQLVGGGPNDVPLEERIGEKVIVKITELDEEEGTILVSERDAAMEEINARLQEYKRGQLVEGTIQGKMAYGFFVTLKGGVTAMLHVSQISNRFFTINDVPLQPGQQIKAMVNKVDMAQGRVQLSTRVLEKEPGQMLMDPDSVFATADEMVTEINKKMEEEEEARKKLARMFFEQTFGTDLRDDQSMLMDQAGDESEIEDSTEEPSVTDSETTEE